MEMVDFLKEFYKRTCPIPAASKSHNYCLAVNLEGARNSFIVDLEEFLETNQDKALLRIRGQTYYLEILNGKSMLDFFKSISQQTDLKDFEEQLHDVL